MDELEIAKRPLVSVMMPCYNAADTLPVALGSLIAQSYTNWECLLVDDGSTDQPESVVREFQDPRIHVIRLNRNYGRGVARQVALEQASGSFLCFLDADDWLYPSKLHAQLHAFGRFPSLAVVSSALAVANQGGQIIGVAYSSAESAPQVRTFDRLSRLPFNAVASMVRMADAKRGCYNPKYRRSQDLDFLLQVALGKQYLVLGMPLYAYTGWSHLPLSKMRESLLYEQQIFASYWRSSPAQSFTNALTCFAKRLTYPLLYATKMHDHVSRRRVQEPTEAQVREYAEASRLVRFSAEISGAANAPHRPQ